MEYIDIWCHCGKKFTIEYEGKLDHIAVIKCKREE